MTVKVEEHDGSNENKGSVHCETCWRTLKRESTTEEILGQQFIDLLSSVATKHEQRHPTHNLTVHLYRKTPKVDG